MNNISIICTLAKEPDYREMPDGKPVCSLRCVWSKKFTTKDGKQNEKSVWFDTQVYGRIATNCRQFLSKGSKVAITGELDYQEWQDKSGKMRNKLFVTASAIDFLTNASGNAPRGQNAPQTAQNANNRHAPVSPQYNPANQMPLPPPDYEETQCNMDDDIPF